MKKSQTLTALLVVLAILALNAQTTYAFPPLPSGFYGSVKIDGANVPAGTVVTARINGVQYASTVITTYLGDTVFSLNVPGDDTDSPGVIDGGVPGDTVVFFIGSRQAQQTAAWSSGSNVALNLTAVGNFAPVITEGVSAAVTMSTAFDLTLHATDADGDEITWSIVTPASHGAATASGAGASKVIGYTPTPQYVGADSFVVQVSDGRGGTDTITVNVTVRAVIFLPLVCR